MAAQSVAVRRAFPRKCDVFRWQFEQTDEQLLIKNANGAEDADLDILFLLKRAESRIDFSQAPNE